MKKIIKPAEREEVKFLCDNHPDIECFSSLKITSWYGSSYDCSGLEVHYCDECLDKIYKFLKQKPEEIPLY